MARANKNHLDRILREWVDQKAEDGDREALLARISRAIEEVPQQPHPDRGRQSDRRSRGAFRAICATTAVAIVLLVLVVRQAWSPSGAGRPSGEDGAAQKLLAELDADELQRRLALLDQLDELFDERWEWLVECGDHVDMRVGMGVRTASLSGEVAMRLTVLVRDDPGEKFRVQEKTFVLTREEQAVEAVLEDGVSRKLYFWAFPIDQGLFTYDVDLQTAGPRELSISASGVVASGTPTKILSFEQGGSEYRVYLLLVPAKEKTSSGEVRQL